MRENCELQDFARSEGRVEAIETNQGRMRGDAFVVTTGAMTPQLSSPLGCALPIQPGKGYCLTMPRPASDELR